MRRATQCLRRWCKNWLATMIRQSRGTHNVSLDGIVNLDKPFGITSARALDQVRIVTHQRKSGHGGTLDPLATGVLLICLGRSTKLVEMIMDQPKVYRATARFDVTSVGYDMERELVPVEIERVPTQVELLDACRTFEGTIQQVPPDRSAVKIGGVPAYKLSARGKTLDLQPRIVNIHWLHMHSYSWPTVDLEMSCSRGTYVRSLIRDLGAKLGVGGCLTSLERRRVGLFTVEQACSVESMRARRDELDFVIPHEQAVNMMAVGQQAIPDRPCVPSGIDAIANRDSERRL